MSVYIFCIIWGVLFGLLVRNGRELLPWRKDNQYYYFEKRYYLKLLAGILSVLPCTYFAAMRQGIGTDYYYAYYPSFYKIMSGERVFSEWGFYMLNRIILFFTDNVQVLFFVTSVMTAAWIFGFMYKQSENYAMSMYLMFASQFYFVSLNNIRQCLSFAISAYSLGKLEEKKYISFVLLNVLSGLMHQTGFIYLLLYFASKIKINVKAILIFTSVSGFFGYFVIQKMVDFLALNTKLGDYFTYAMYTKSTIPLYCAAVQIGILGFFLYGRWVNADRVKADTDIYIILQVCAVIICFADQMIPAAYRFLRLFSFFQIVSVPNCIAQFEKKEERWIWTAVFLTAITFVCVLEIFIQGNEAILPYQMYRR
ncbi:MAG: EpsG family protein [Lachnospiraceae bacterium]|nr:EpsG family protein [Lachnospiraceae bacterium]